MVNAGVPAEKALAECTGIVVHGDLLAKNI